MGGEPKALLSFGGRPLVQHIVETLETVFAGCLVVTSTPERFAFLGRRTVGDVFPEGGSLGGIYSGLAAAGTPAALCVACDMPFLSAGLLADLASYPPGAAGGLPEAAGGSQPLHAVYGRACLPAMERRLRAGQLRIVDFLQEVSVLTVGESRVREFGDPARLFMNLNTPDDLAQARVLWESPARGEGGAHG